MRRHELLPFACLPAQPPTARISRTERPLHGPGFLSPILLTASSVAQPQLLFSGLQSLRPDSDQPTELEHRGPKVFRPRGFKRDRNASHRVRERNPPRVQRQTPDQGLLRPPPAGAIISLVA